MKSERKQISLRMPTWHRIRALANAEEHDCFMGDMMARIVDEWCVGNGWEFALVPKTPGSQELLACRYASHGQLDTPAPAPKKLSPQGEGKNRAGMDEMADLPRALG